MTLDGVFVCHHQDLFGDKPFDAIYTHRSISNQADYLVVDLFGTFDRAQALSRSEPDDLIGSRLGCNLQVARGQEYPHVCQSAMASTTLANGRLDGRGGVACVNSGLQTTRLERTVL